LLNAVLVLAALAIAAAALMGKSDAKPDTPTLDVLNSDGVVQMSNSRAGLPIVTAENLAPGQSASGQVTLENTGTARGYFYLRPHGLVSPAGPGGGQLADNLLLHVTLTKGGVTSRKYAGLISKMGTITAGRFSPGESGTYTFEVEAKNTGIPAPPTLSRPVRGDNKYQGTSASVDFRWSTYP
jgi:hypothetical protein